MAEFLDRLREIASVVGLVGRVARLPTPPALTLDERLGNLPLRGAPVREAVSIRWDEYALPFIEASSVEDLAVGVGVVHAHLRLGQMEIMRRLAQGRIAEMIGPAGVRYDVALRCLDLSRAVPEMIAMLPNDSRVWAEAFLAGVNHVIFNAPEMPLDCAFLGIGRTAWTMHDLMTLARLASADITWAPALKLLRFREGMGRAAWLRLWPELVGGGLGVPEGPAAVVARGSNSAAVGGARTISGAAMIASDPHVGLQLPSIWLAACLVAPGFCASGLMIPGLPTVAIGRNADIAWGATNLHAGSSVFVDLGAEDDARIVSREVEILVRGGAARRVVVRDSRFGPVISDCRVFGLRRPTALGWVGHRASDELSAMLAVNRAGNFEEFRAGLKGFAVQGYSFTYADRTGRVGIVRAAHVPVREGVPADLVEPAGLMEHLVCLAETETKFDPPEGFIVSANEDPGGVRAGYFYSAPDRAARLAALLDRGGLARGDMEALQRDVRAPAAVVWRDRLAARAKGLGVALPAAFLDWDGGYDEGSAGALAYEMLMGEAARLMIGRMALKALQAGWTGRGQILARLVAADDAALRPALRRAAARTARALRRKGEWGRAHRLQLAHPLGRLPLARRVFGWFAFGVPGSNDTLYKMGHKPVRARRGGRHFVSYGASARHIADFAGVDDNFVVILGGQDGWIGSVNASDQIALWREGRYLRLPLTRSGAARPFSWITSLSPEG